jgi:hypothetical protein
LLADPAAALPRATYYFRDLTLTFLPLRLFQAREIAAGRFPWWNPFSHEGSPMLPVLYPLDLLHALWPSPEWISWLLTLHLPLAALGAYCLARTLGAGRPAACVSGAVYALGGLTLSSLSVYVYLEAAAWAPLQAAMLIRAAERGRHWVALAALLQAVALSTLAIEFTAQAVVLGVALGLARQPSWRSAGRLAAACALGLGVAGLPILVILGVLPETVRAQGSARAAVEHALTPWSLVQVLMPGVFGSLSEPLGRWWGALFQARAYPYFFSLYLGPAAVALAVCGAPALERRVRATLLALAALGLWYALGPSGGLAVWLSDAPLIRSLRFPSKAALLPHLVAALLTGSGVARLAAGRGWRAIIVASGLVMAVALLVGWCALHPAAAPWPWPSLGDAELRLAREAVPREALTTVALAAAGALAAGSVALRVLRPVRAAALIAAVAILDLARAGAGMNPQVRPDFMRLLPEIAALRLDALEGGRVFSFGTRGGAWLERLSRGLSGANLAHHFLERQTLAAYTNVLDGIETAQSRDLTAFVLHEPLIGALTRRPTALADGLPRLRASGVVRVISLEPVGHAELRDLAQVDSGVPGLPIRVYALERALPRAYVACRVLVEPSRERATWRALEGDFDGSRDVVLEQGVEAGCAGGSVVLRSGTPATAAYDVSLDGPGLLVTRDSFARGWRVEVDGAAATLLRANGRYRAVALAAGRHQVTLEYRPPGLAAGAWVSVLAAAATGLLALRAASRPGP